MKKRISSLLLCVVLFIGLIPLIATAADISTVNTEYTISVEGNYTLTTVNGKLPSLPNVARSDGAILEGWYTEKYGGDKVTTDYIFTADTTIYAHWTPKSAQNPFTDVVLGSYYAEAVFWAVDKGIAKGITETTFEPETACTRAHAVTFLWRYAGSPNPKSTKMPFTDVPSDSYYYNAVLWAVENNITTGTDTNIFNPNAVCTRAHIVTFLWRANGSIFINGKHPFTDVKVNSYYEKAVLWAVDGGITKGINETEFCPDLSCTRAQIVTFLSREK